MHAVFGAFIFGACLPGNDRLLRSLAARIEPISIVILMPLFFALAGLGTSASAFSGGSLGAMAVILLVAIVGKLAGGAIGARLAGYGWRESLATGSLMNARGLMELIVMKVGLDAGLIGEDLFTMLLIMALVTTAMTGPMMTLFAPRARSSMATSRSQTEYSRWKPNCSSVRRGWTGAGFIKGDRRTANPMRGPHTRGPR